MNRQEIIEKMTEIIIDKLGVTAEEVKPEADFEGDLGADSLDMVELIMEVEKEFSISVPDFEAEGIKTVKQAIDLVEEKVV